MDIFKDLDKEFILLLDSINEKLKSKKLLILDLDHTIISTVSEEKYDFIIPKKNEDKFYILKRPYTQEFLDFIFNHFDIGIWSAANIEYINVVINNVFKDYRDKIKFIYTNEHCFTVNNIIYKPLNIMFTDISDIIILDDNPDTFKHNIHNAIKIKGWYGNQEDDKLLHCMKILEKIKDKDIIEVNKIHKYYEGF